MEPPVAPPRRARCPADQAAMVLKRVDILDNPFFRALEDGHDDLLEPPGDAGAISSRSRSPGRWPRWSAASTTPAPARHPAQPRRAVFTAWPFAGKGPEGKPPLQFGEEGAGLITVVAAHPAAEFVAGGYNFGELQLGDIKTRRSVVLKLSDGSAVSALAWSPDGLQLAAGNDNGDLLVIDLRR